MNEEKCESCGSGIKENNLEIIKDLLKSFGYEFTIFINWFNLDPIYYFKKLDTEALVQIYDRKRLVDFLGGILYTRGFYLVEEDGKLDVFSLKEMNDRYTISKRSTGI